MTSLWQMTSLNDVMFAPFHLRRIYANFDLFGLRVPVKNKLQTIRIINVHAHFGVYFHVIHIFFILKYFHKFRTKSWHIPDLYSILYLLPFSLCQYMYWGKTFKTKRRRSDPVLWQKPLHQQKCQKGKVTTQTTPQKCSIKQQLRTDLGRSVGVATATQLVWLTGLWTHLESVHSILRKVIHYIVKVFVHWYFPGGFFFVCVKKINLLRIIN